MPYLDSVDTPDTYTAIIHAKQPWNAVFDLLRDLWIADSVTDKDKSQPTPAGTGPYMFKEYVQGDHLALVKNPNYWKQGVPYLDTITERYVADPQALLLNFESGSVDVVTTPPSRDLKRYMGDRNFKVLRSTQPTGYIGYVCNTTIAPTNNKQFRQALSYALNRQRIAQTVFQGMDDPWQLPWAPSSPAYNAAKNSFYTFDLTKAKELIAQSSVGSTPFEIEFASTFADYPDYAQVWQQDLASLGLNVTLKPLAPPEWFGNYNSVMYQGVSLVLAPGLAWNPATILLGPYTKPGRNATGFASDTYTQLVQTLQSEPDPAKLKQAYARMNDLLLDEAFHLATVATYTSMVTHPRVQGVAIDPFPIGPYNAAWLSA